MKSIASNQTRGFRLVGTYPITQDNQQLLVDIPRGPHIESCVIRIRGTINVTTIFTTVRNLSSYLFMRNVQWVLNSNVTLDSVSGAQLRQLYVTRRQQPVATAPSAALGATTFEASFILDRALMDMVRPKDSMLKTDVGISNNQLRIQLGALADMYTGAGVATYTNVSASVYLTDYQEVRTNGQTPAPMFYVKRNGQRQSLPSAGNGQQVKLNTGNRLRMISLQQLIAATGEPDLTYTLVNRFRVQRAGDTRVDMSVLDLLSLNSSTYGIPMAGGQSVIDFANTGQISGVRYSEFWPIPSSADTYLLVDTTAASILDIATIEGVDLAMA